MKDLGRTIERILRIEPDLETELDHIRIKWKRYPKRTMLYWKQLFKVLNNDEMIQHPRRNEIRDILIPKRRDKKHTYSFEEAGPHEQLIGVIPENIADKIRRHDRISIRLGKQSVEASMTRNHKMMIDLQRQNSKMEINLKKIWFELKDHFKLWDRDGHFSIKKRSSFLVLALKQPPSRPQMPPPPGIPGIPETPDGVGFVRMTPDMLKNFFRYMNIKPPPGIFPEEDDGE